MAIYNLPFIDRIDRSSGPTSEGYKIKVANYDSKVSQKAFDGPSQQAAKQEVWTINWRFIQYATPAEVLAGQVNELQQVLDFYESAYIERVRWSPFELGETRVWEIVPDSLTRNNPAGSMFNVSIKLRFLYKE